MNAPIKDIRERAVLAQWKMSLWTGIKIDKDVTADVAKRNEAKGSKVGAYKKRLVPKSALEECIRIANRTRAFHFENTLPWMNEGMRILPAKNLAPYMKKMREFKKQADDAAETFLNNYADYILEAKQSLGKMFNPADYPTKESIRDKFGFHIVVMPIPEIKDWRVDISKKDLDALKKQAMEDIAETQKDAMLDLWKRLHTVVARVKERLDKDDGIFRDSLIENITEVLDVLPALNITDDPELNKVATEVKSKLAKVTPGVLRENSTARKQVAKDADTIMKKMDLFMKKKAGGK